MSRVLLLSSNTATSPYPVYPLGVSMLAAALENDGHEVRQGDYLACDRSEDRIREAITGFDPDFVGISIRNIDNVDSFGSAETWYLPNDQRLVEIIRDTTSALVIVGGSGFSLLPEQVLDYLGADFGVVGEGEFTLCDLIRQITDGTSPPPVVSSQNHLLEGASIPMARWDEAVVDYYRKGAIGVQSKRGCPHGCSYCTYPVLEGAALRCREPESVADEIESLYLSHGVDRFFFTDSIFNDADGHYLLVAEALLHRALPVTWSAFISPRGIDRDNLRLLKRAGLASVEIGTDAAHDGVLRELHKPFSFDDVVSFQEVCSSEKIPAAHYIMFGAPGETEQTLSAGLKNIERLKRCVVFGFSGIRIFPKTELHQQAINEALIQEDNNLLTPAFYFSPHIERDRMETTVEQAFRGRRDRIFPPTDGQEKLKVLNRFGYTGSLWERLLSF